MPEHAADGEVREALAELDRRAEVMPGSIGDAYHNAANFARRIVAHYDALAAQVEAARRALDDELSNLADDGARLSYSVVRRIEAALSSPSTKDKS